jgi:hypothetical protein
MNDQEEIHPQSHIWDVTSSRKPSAKLITSPNLPFPDMNWMFSETNVQSCSPQKKSNHRIKIGGSTAVTALFDSIFISVEVTDRPDLCMCTPVEKFVLKDIHELRQHMILWSRNRTVTSGDTSILCFPLSQGPGDVIECWSEVVVVRI